MSDASTPDDRSPRSGVPHSGPSLSGAPQDELHQDHLHHDDLHQDDLHQDDLHQDDLHPDDLHPNDLPLDEPVVYAVTLAPHRSLTARGFLLVMTLIGVISFIAGAVFLAMGAWPIFGFFGLDVLLIYFAFRANFRAAAAREHISVTPSMVEVRYVPVKGRERVARLNPFWTRIWRKDDEDHGTLDVALVSGRTTVPVGRFLGPVEKGILAGDLTDALNAVKKGVTRSTF